MSRSFSSACRDSPKRARFFLRALPCRDPDPRHPTTFCIDVAHGNNFDRDTCTCAADRSCRTSRTNDSHSTDLIVSERNREPAAPANPALRRSGVYIQTSLSRRDLVQSGLPLRVNNELIEDEVIRDEIRTLRLRLAEAMPGEHPSTLKRAEEWARDNVIERILLRQAALADADQCLQK